MMLAVLGRRTYRLPRPEPVFRAVGPSGLCSSVSRAGVVARNASYIGDDDVTTTRCGTPIIGENGMLKSFAARLRVSPRLSAALMLMAWSCRSQSSSVATGESSIAAVHSQDADVRCASDSKASDSIAFAVVDLTQLKRDAALQGRFITGPKTRTAVLDSLAWPSAWHAAVDSLPVLPIPFDGDALLLVATPTYTIGPLEIGVVAIRRCRATHTVVVAVQETARDGARENYGSRDLSVVRVRRSALAGNQVKFIDLPRLMR